MDRPTFLADEETEDVVRFTIGLPSGEHALLKELGELYDALARIQGRKRAKKWKVNRLVQRMVAAQVDALSAQMGVDLRDPSARALRFSQARAEAEREAGHRSKPKKK